MRQSTMQQGIRFRELEGHRVALRLTDGTYLDDVCVISAGGGAVASLWLDQGGVDLFVEKSDIVSAIEAAVPRAA